MFKKLISIMLVILMVASTVAIAAKPGDVLLFKASHGMHLELVLEAFLKKEK